MCVRLPAACWPGPAKSHKRGGVQSLSLSLSWGEEGVKRYELLPGDVVAAEKEALQAGQAFHLSLERETERGRGKRERRRDVKKRRYLERGHCIVTVVRAPLHPLSHLAALSSSTQHPHPSCACTHTHKARCLVCTWRGGAVEREWERAWRGKGEGRGRKVCAALMRRSPTAGC